MFFSHNNLANNLYLYEKNMLKEFNFQDITKNANWVDSKQSHTDLNRLKLGKVYGQVSKSCNAKHCIKF